MEPTPCMDGANLMVVGRMEGNVNVSICKHKEGWVESLYIPHVEWRLAR